MKGQRRIKSHRCANIWGFLGLGVFELTEVSYRTCMRCMNQKQFFLFPFYPSEGKMVREAFSSFVEGVAQES